MSRKPLSQAFGLFCVGVVVGNHGALHALREAAIAARESVS